MYDSSKTRSALRSHWPLETKVSGTNKNRFVQLFVLKSYMRRVVGRIVKRAADSITRGCEEGLSNDDYDDGNVDGGRGCVRVGAKGDLS